MIKDNPYCLCIVDLKNNFLGFITNKNKNKLDEKLKGIKGIKKYGYVFKVTTWKKTF